MPSHTQFLGFTVLMLFIHREILSDCLFYKQELSTNAKFCWVYVLNYLFSSPWYVFFLGLFCKELGNLQMSIVSAGIKESLINIYQSLWKQPRLIQYKEKVNQQRKSIISVCLPLPFFQREDREYNEKRAGSRSQDSFLLSGFGQVCLRELPSTLHIADFLSLIVRFWLD